MNITDSYKILKAEDGADWYVQLTSFSGIWKNLIISYSKVNFLEGKIKFSWKCEYAPEHLKEFKNFPKETYEQLEILLGKILFDVLSLYEKFIKIENNKLIIKFEEINESNS